VVEHVTELEEIPQETLNVSDNAAGRASAAAWRRLFRFQSSRRVALPQSSRLVAVQTAMTTPQEAPAERGATAKERPEVCQESDHRIRLPDGRWLGYAEYGDARGKPLICFHGGLSCRLDVRFASRQCSEAGVRLLSVDRPGIGLSSPQPDRTLLGWPKDVAHLARALGIARFAVLGWSAGGPYALACAHEIPELLTYVGTVGCMAQVDIRPETVRESGLQMDRVLFPLVRRSPQTAGLLLNAVRHVPPWLLKRSLLREVAGASDRSLIRSFAIPRDFEFFYESFRSGPSGAVNDYRVLGGSWGFHLKDIKKTVHLWQGGEDRLIPISQARWLADRLPSAQLHVLPNEGHFLIRSCLSQILTVLLA
jgi:pimeloyl-ACP methyl ester carboxylesterase